MSDFLALLETVAQITRWLIFGFTTFTLGRLYEWAKETNE